MERLAIEIVAIRIGSGLAIMKDSEELMTKSFALFAALSFVLVACVMEEEVEIEENLSEAYEEILRDDGSADSARCSGVVVPDRGPFNRRIALTFDDGPSLTNTAEVVEILERHNATGTFFINGKAVRSEEHWQLLRDMVAAGHIVGNHTQNHPNSVTLSSSRFRQEVQSTHDIVSQLDQTASFFRFPFGSSNCTTAGIVEEFGYHITGWHIDTADWCFGSGTGGVGYCDPRTFRHVPDRYRSDYVGFTLHQARNRGGGILLMHDVHSFTVNQLDAVLTALEEDGFEFVSLDDISVFPLLNGEVPEPEPWVGDTCHGAEDDCGFSYGESFGSCELYSGEGEEDLGYCVLPCEGRCPDRGGHATTFCVESSVEPGAGVCVPKAEEINDNCASIPGTIAEERARFIGDSGVQESTAVVCVPE